MRTASLIDELEATLNSSSSVQRADILRRVTDLFLQGAEQYDADHVGVFDDVMERLVGQIEGQALARLAERLAPVDNAPSRTVHQLAGDDDIAISGPVITRSTVLGDDVLIDIARTKSQAHLAAIAGRDTIAERVTDVLVDRGDTEVTRKVTGNRGARFSKPALVKVAEKAGRDAQLAETMVARADVPPDVFEHLLRKATDVVKTRLLKSAEPDTRAKITRTLAEIASTVARPRPPAESGTSPRAFIQADPAKLKARIGALAQAGKRDETIDALAGLSKLPAATVRNLMRVGSTDGLLILCKSVGLGWPDVKAVLGAVGGGLQESEPKLFERYRGLSLDTANRVVRFVKSCKAVSTADFQRML